MAADTESKSRAWDALPNETSKAYRAFGHFLSLGPGRTIVQAARDLDYSSPVTLYQWSAKYDWWGRSKLFDAASQVQALDAAKDAQANEYVDLANRSRARAARLAEAADVLIDFATIRLKHAQRARLKAIESGQPEEDLPPPEVDKHTADCLRLAGQVAAQSTEAEALALGVDRLVGLLDGAVDEG